MSADNLQSALAAAKAIQSNMDDLGLPPPASTPSRSNTVVPITLVKGTRGYIEIVAHQVNKSYDGACFDACAVMIRRLVETLIIEVYEAHGTAAEIKDPGTGDYFYLSKLIDKVNAATAWTIGRNAKKGLSALKDVGDKSAHSRRFNAVRHDIDELKPHLRDVVQELVYLMRHPSIRGL